MGESYEPDYVVVGMGVNMNQTYETFRAAGLEDIASSLAGEGYPVERNRLAVCLLCALDRMVRDFPEQRADWLAQYHQSCITVGRRVSFEWDGQELTGTASAVSDRFALIIQGDDGNAYTVTSGTVRML